MRARLKRVFPRAPQAAAEVIRISDTPENSRDLDWFLERYPMTVVDGGTARLRAQTERHRAEEQAVDALLTGDRVFEPVELAEPAREYQQLAAALLKVKGGQLCGDDVGLGKTVTAICSMPDPAHRPALVVVPAQLTRQWARRIAQFCPALRVHVINHGTPGALPDPFPDVLVVSYHRLRGWAERLAGVVKLVVFDECQQLRHPGSLIYAAARHVAQAATLVQGLSATPIYGYGEEFFWVVNVILPGALGEREEFVREWCTGGRSGKARISDPAEFGAYLRREGIMIRRTRAEVGRELPPLSKILHEVDAEVDDLKAVGGNAVELARIVLAHNERYRGEKMQAAGEFDAMMRQATGIAKAPYVAEFVRLLLDSEPRVILFGWHRDVYAIWQEKLAEFNPVLYTGSESVAQKDASLRRFTEGDARVLIISLRAGQGVDGLQGSTRVAVFGELDWSPGVHEQCIGRFYRDGQPDPCLAYFVTSMSGADPVMINVLGVKRGQIEPVRNPGAALVERLDEGTGIQQLARDFLTRRGVALPAPEPTAEPVGAS